MDTVYFMYRSLESNRLSQKRSEIVSPSFLETVWKGGKSKGQTARARVLCSMNYVACGNCRCFGLYRQRVDKASGNASGAGEQNYENNLCGGELDSAVNMLGDHNTN